MTWLETLKQIWTTVTHAHDHVDRFEQAGSSCSPALAFMKLAMQQAEVGDLETALQNFQQALIIEPERADIYANLGIVLAKAGRLKEAEQRFAFAAEREPERAIYYVLWGACLVDLGELDEARKQYEIAISLRPRHAEPWMNWAVALSRTGYLEEALPKLKRVLQLNPNNPQAFYLWGAILAEKKHYEEALNKLTTCLKYEAHHTDALFLSAVIKHKLGKHLDAIALLETFQKLIPDKPEALHVCGDCYLSLHRLEEAQAYLEEAEFLLPESPDILLSKARLLDQQGRSHQALSLLEHLNLQSSPPKGFLQVWANILLNTGDMPKALTILEKQDLQHLDDEEILQHYQTRITLLSQLEEASLLKIAINEAQARFPEEAGFYFAEGTLLSKEGRYTDALQAFRHATEQDASLKEAPLNVGLMLLQTHDFENAVRHLRILYRQNPSDALTVTIYGIAQLANGQDKEALLKFETICTASQAPPLGAFSAWIYATALNDPEHLEDLLNRAYPLGADRTNDLHWPFTKAVAYYLLDQEKSTSPMGSLYEASLLWQDLQSKIADLKGHPLGDWKEVTPWHLWLLTP